MKAVVVASVVTAVLSAFAIEPYPERSIYFATHFFNWYEEASDAEVEQYVEELAEWGLTGVAAWFDMHDFTGIDDPAAQKRIARLKLIFNTARRLGIDRHLHFLANEAFKDSPGELAQRPVPRHIRFSFRAKGDGAIRVAFYRYTDVADTNSLDRLKKHTYKRVHHTPHGVGGTFSLTPEMATYSGEYTIAPGEWCAIAFHREKSSEPATVADVSVVVVDE